MNENILKDRHIYFSSMLFIVLTIFMPFYERYAYNFFYAATYAYAVTFFAVFVRREKMSSPFIFLIRAGSFAYTVFLSMRYNPGFAMIGFLSIYQITRLLEGTYFENYIMTFTVNLMVLYLSLPNHSGAWIMFYSLAFVIISIYFVVAHSAYFDSAQNSQPATVSPGGDIGFFRFVKTYAAYVLVCAFIIFVATPRVRLNLFNPFYLHFAGISSSFNFNSVENIKESSSVIMRITRDGDAGNYYKMKSYNRYWLQRHEWISNSFGGRRVYGDGGGNYVINKGTAEITSAPGAFVNTTFYVKTNPEGYVPHLFFPMSVNLQTRSLYTDYMDNIYASEGEGTINVRSYVINPDEQTLKKAAGPDPLRIKNYYLMYPFRRLEDIKELAQKITAPHKTRYDKTMAIVNYLKDNYKYTMAVGDLYQEYKDSEYDPNQVFLFLVKAGHCEFFASSMVLMCQSAGIPARLVSGFATPEYNENGNYYLVRGSDAHAWVEVYFPGIGFVSFDPTAASSESEKSRSKIFAFLNKYFDSFNFYIENYVSYFSNEYLYRLFAAAYRETISFFKNMGETAAEMLKSSDSARGDETFKYTMEALKSSAAATAPAALLAAAAMWLLISGRVRPYLFRALNGFLGDKASYRLARLLTPNVRRRVDFYEKFTAAMKKYGLKKDPGETPNEFTERIEKSGLVSAAILEKCKTVAGCFYARECAGKTLTPGELGELDLMIMEIETVK